MIESIKNETVKQILKLHKKKYRDETNRFLLEGEHLVEEALKSDWQIDRLIVREDYGLIPSFKALEQLVVSHKVFDHLSLTPSPQGVMAVVKRTEPNLSYYHRLLVLDRVQDPGNLGTLIRTADAFKFDAVICLDGTVDVFNDKVIRATQGSLFHLPVLKMSESELLTLVSKQQIQLVVTTLNDAKPLEQLTTEDKLAVVVGNEGQGVTASLLKAAHQKIKITIPGQAESLNVGIAAGIIMYQVQGR
ncbi:TrmH family RNA methyltransferase [Streptohalobacillus salinus]|uniref:TrmH family RNA methyltransferase n=1 Tax=Streptohalobacillus salinus TaxID=621096 RepID=A0A2V3WAN4_9BACI|nr:RNA methyltransferase [Streptohalobacillus salinus]PXW90071.1 TrmH family RNA methyltransferase [Streptohalobacillus salinus]